MPALPRWLSLALLPLAAFFEAGAYYASRGVLGVHLREGLSLEDVGYAFTGASVAVLVGTVLAGLVAIAAGPWILAAVGAGLVVLAAVMLGVLPPEAGVLGAVLLGFGWGVGRTALFGAAARAFPDYRTEHLRNAACFALYGAANLAAWGSAAGSAELALSLGTSAAFTAAAGAAVLPVILVAGLGVAVWVTRERKDALTEPPLRRGDAHLYVIGGAILLGGFVWTFWSSSFELLFSLVSASEEGYDAYRWLVQLNPLIVVAGCALAFAVSLGLHLGKVRAPTLVVLGVGLLMISAGLVALLGADTADDAIVLPAVLVLGVGEAIAAPLLLSRLMGDVPKRLPTLAVAVFYALTTGPTLLLRLVQDEIQLERAFSVLGATGALAVGVLAIVLGVLLRRALHPDPDEPAEF